MELHHSRAMSHSLVKDTFPDSCVPFNLDKLLNTDIAKFVVEDNKWVDPTLINTKWYLRVFSVISNPQKYIKLQTYLKYLSHCLLIENLVWPSG